MFVGHGLLAFAIVALAGERLGWDRAVVVPAAVLAGLFGTLPDVDVVYGLVGLVEQPSGTVEAFWAAGNRVHRGLTHALPVGLVTAGAVGLLAGRDAWSLAGGAVLVGVVALATVVWGGLGGLVATAFVAGASALARAGRRRGLTPRAVAGAALVGLLTHPFGDLFTGSPPAMLYPLDAVVVADRIELAADPTLHLLAAFGVELAAVGVAFVAACRVTDRRAVDQVRRRAALGVVYGGAAFVLPAPTLAVSYQFVYSVLAVGVVGAAPAGWPTVPSLPRTDVWRAVGTALATVAVAAGAYAVVYVLV
ncbi:MAG: metal-dependent hydrolase [Halobellus sp.]|uniref:metal-dependent hydrolase n=1 Tax=Halobellus sp. TaxID=1979212 RepID=UPI0035D4E7B7